VFPRISTTIDIRQIIKQGIIRRMRDIQLKEKQMSDSIQGQRRTNEEFPKMPSDFECFVCGALFTTNEERKQHLGKYAHNDMYDTVSPQEREDVRRFSNIS
jgi:hypothetical protein